MKKKQVPYLGIDRAWIKRLCFQIKVKKAEELVAREAEKYGKCVPENVTNKEERELLDWYIKTIVGPSLIEQLSWQTPEEQVQSMNKLHSDYVESEKGTFNPDPNGKRI